MGEILSEERDGVPPRSFKVLHVAEVCQAGVGTCMAELIMPQIQDFGVDNIRVLAPHNHIPYLEPLPSECILGYQRSGRDIPSLASLARTIVHKTREFRPDIVHLHSTFAGAVGRLSLAGIRPRPLVVYCAHDWAFTTEVSPVMKGMYAAVERLLCPLTDALTHISVTQFREAERRRVTARHSVVVYNAIADRPLPSLARAEEGPVNLLFAGMFRPQKGLDILLRAMAHLEDAPIRLDVVGAGIDGQERILGATSNVTFHGWKRREDIETMYATTDALILPSRWDGHSMSGLEAMRAGAPLIVSNRGGLPELVDYGSAGLIFELSETDTSDLERVLRGITRSELRRLGSAARKRFETHYTGDVMHRSTVELYASLRREDVHKQAVSEPPQ